MGKLKTTLFLTQIPLKEFFFSNRWGRVGEEQQLGLLAFM